MAGSIVLVSHNYSTWTNAQSQDVREAVGGGLLVPTGTEVLD